MLKKILTLSLVAVILSVTAFAIDPMIAAFADADETLFDNNNITILHVLQDANGTRTVSETNWKNNYVLDKPADGSTGWALVKIQVGRHVEFDSVKFNANFYLTAGGAYGYCAPWSKAEFDVAATGADLNTLVQPTETAPNIATDDCSNDATVSRVLEFTLNDEAFSEGSNYYQDGCIYLAVWGDSKEENVTTLGMKVPTAFNLTVTGTVPEQFTGDFVYDNMEFLYVSQAVDGTRTVSAPSTSKVNVLNKPADGSSGWALVKIPVGENLVFDKIDFTVNIYHNIGTPTAYCAPLSKTDYDAAASGNAASLTRPGAGVPNVVTTVGTTTTANGKNQTMKFTLDASVFNNSSYYQDGHIYLAFWGEVADNNAVCTFDMRSGKTDVYKLHVEAIVAETPVVDDFSDAVVEYDNTTGEYSITTTTTTGEAYLIIASFTGTTMNDVELVTINAAEGLNGIVTPLDAGTIKIFLWNSTTLAPAIGVSEF